MQEQSPRDAPSAPSSTSSSTAMLPSSTTTTKKPPRAFATQHRRLGSIDTDHDPLLYADDPLSPSHEHHDDDMPIQQQQQCGPIRRIYYDDSNHLQILTTLYGSVWLKVLPYCIASMLLCMCVFYLKKYQAYLTTDALGHKFMSMILSFLVVTRAQITVARFMQARTYLNVCYKSCRELIQLTCVLTQDDMSTGARVYRHNIAYRTILLLRVSMAAIEYESQQTTSWEIPELLEDDRNQLKESLMLKNVFRSMHKRKSSSSGGNSDGASASQNTPSPSHHETTTTTTTTTTHRTLQEESFRAPLILMLNLRKEIMLQRSGAYLENPFRHVNEELLLLDCVSTFNKGFHGLQKLVNQPFPFPLTQMTRTFLFVFVFTLPFVLCHDDNQYLLQPLLTIFLITYGFVGIEYVCMELADPFGDDPNDFDDLGLAQLVFEDIYIAIYKLDGDEAAHDLRRKIVKRMQRGPALETFVEERKQGGYGRESPVCVDNDDGTIEFDRRLYYKQQQQEDDSSLNLPFRYNKHGEVQEDRPKFRIPIKASSLMKLPTPKASLKKLRQSLRGSSGKKSGSSGRREEASGS